VGSEALEQFADAVADGRSGADSGQLLGAPARAAVNADDTDLGNIEEGPRMLARHGPCTDQHDFEGDLPATRHRSPLHPANPARPSGRTGESNRAPCRER